MINIEEEYIGLLAGVLYGGKEKKDRTGTGTRSVFGRTIRPIFSPIIIGLLTHDRESVEYTNTLN